MIDLYSEMGWELDKEIAERKLRFYDDADCFGYEEDIFEVYKTIEKLEDDLEFCYAILTLLNGINEDRALYNRHVRAVYDGIEKFNLSGMKNLIKSKKIETVFIAMSFDEKMDSARKHITKVIKDCGYQEIIIDVKEHNNQIVPEIYKEIEKSKFVVADLTGQRPGVYYEAGYAVASEKQVIFSCKASEKNKVHFDVAQINTIFWQNEYDLQDRLLKRIEATVGRR